MFPGKYDISWTVAVLAPFYSTGPKFNTLKRAIAVFFETEHTVKMAIMINGCTPVINNIIGFTPDLFAGKFTSVLLDSEKTRPCIVFTQGERALKIPLSNKNLVSDLNPLISYGSGFSFAILEQAFIETLQEPLMDVYEGITERTSNMLKQKLAHNHPDVWWKWTVG